MSMMMRRGMMVPKAPGGLPAEYLAVQYLESTGTQWIKTDIESRFAMTFEMEQAYTSSAGDTYGAGLEDNGFSICVDGNYLNHYQWKYQGTYRDISSGIPSVNVKYKFRSELKPGNQNIYRDDVLIQHDNIVQTSTTLTGKHLGLFCRLVNDTTANMFAKIKLYSLKVYDGNDVLLGNFLPCIRISDSKPGMYDLVGRQFYTNQGTGEFLTGYIADGLVFHLDGIDRGDVTGQWKDIVGGRIATLTGTYTENTNNIYFNGGYGEFNSKPSIGKDDGTIETAVELLAYEGTGRPTVSFGNNYIGGSISSQSSSGYGGAMRWFDQNGSMECWRFPVDSLSLVMTASANSDIGICNGYNGEKITTSSWSSGGNLLAYRGSGNKFIGKMYAVRIYDRKLSAAEMLINQRVDNTRFNLGLTI